MFVIIVRELKNRKWVNTDKNKVRLLFHPLSSMIVTNVREVSLSFFRTKVVFKYGQM